MNEAKSAAYRQILLVFLALAVLTAVEFVVSRQFNSTVILVLIALIKSGLIVNFFMHVYRLWREEKH